MGKARRGMGTEEREVGREREVKEGERERM